MSSNKITYCWVLLCVLFSLITNQCTTSNSLYDELDDFLGTGIISEAYFNNTIKGIMFVPLDGCKCVKQAVTHINKYPDSNIIYVFSSNSEKIIDMNTYKIPEHINVVKDVDNIAPKLGILLDFPILYEMNRGKVFRKIEINGILMNEYFPQSE